MRRPVQKTPEQKTNLSPAALNTDKFMNILWVFGEDAALSPRHYRSSIVLGEMKSIEI